MVFEEYAENIKKIFVIIIFYFFLFSLLVSSKNFLKPNESCLLDRKKPNIAKLVYINFLAVSMKITKLQPVRKFSEKRLFSVNPIKIPLLGYFCMQNSFLSLKRSQSLRFLRYMRKIEKKNIYHYFLFFVIFSISFKQNFLKPNESYLLDSKKPNIAKSVYINFFGRLHENLHAIACSKILRKEVVFCKSYKNTLIVVFLHAEFISALKTERKPMVFEEYAENTKKIFVIIIFYFL